MPHPRIACTLAVPLVLLATNWAPAQTRLLHLDLQTRDPQTSQPRVRTEDVDSSKVAVVIVDPWNFHWCMTACERVSAMVPRWNRAVECARKLGMPILWAPSDVVGMYSGHPARERALAVPLVPVPKVREMPPACFTAPVGGCLCGPGINCIVNYGWDGMNPDLLVADEDLIASSTEEVYSLLEEHGVGYCIMSAPDLPRVMRVTAPFAYVRMHSGGYDTEGNYEDPQLEWWAEQIVGWLRDADVYVYFNNDAHGFALNNARRLREMVSGGMAHG